MATITVGTSKDRESDIVQLYVQGTDAKRMQVATAQGSITCCWASRRKPMASTRWNSPLRATEGRGYHLNDLLTGERVKISDNSSYTFETKKGDVHRFRLASGNIIKDDEASKITVYANENDGSVVINNLTEKDCTVYISDTQETVTKHGGESQNRKVGERVTEGHPGGAYPKCHCQRYSKGGGKIKEERVTNRKKYMYITIDIYTYGSCFSPPSWWVAKMT